MGAARPSESKVFAAVLHRGVRRSTVRRRAGCAAAFWRNFQVKYREINDLHKQMLRTSAKVAAMPRGPVQDAAIDHLQRGQSNDCYWHGLFGGIYISHMRLATYEHLIAAEDLAETATGRLDAAERIDLDMDGLDEVRLADAGQVVTIDPAEGAGIGGWDVRAVRHALAAVMRRRPEAYHDTLRAHEARLALESVAAAADPDDRETLPLPPRPATARAAALRRRSTTSWRRRSRVSPNSSTTTPTSDDRALSDSSLWGPIQTRGRPRKPTSSGDALDRPYEVASLEARRAVLTRDATVRTEAGPAAVRVVKSVAIGGDRRSPALSLTVSVENRSELQVQARLGIEWTLTMLGGGGNPSAWWEVDGERMAHDGRGTARDIATLEPGQRLHRHRGRDHRV